MRDIQRRSFNPAALSAAARGDLANALVAATPGGIEAQEAAGQAMFCASATLPKEMRGCTRATLEAMGIKFGADADDLFVSVTLPPGWKKHATDHSMHSELLDDKGRKRASIFYKAAFYDRNADMQLCHRYGVNAYLAGSDKDHRRVAATDGKEVIQDFGEYALSDYKAGDALRAKAEAWLAAKYPEWTDATAYWD